MSRAARIFEHLGICCLLLLIANACGHNTKGVAMNHSNAEGLWQQSREVPAPNTEGKSLPDTYTFRYEGDLVTLRLLVFSSVSWASPDGFYTLKARWQGDVLQYQPPTGDWTDLATFDGDRFAISGDGMRREFAQITPAQVVDFNADIRKPDRPAFDYDRVR